MGDPIAELEKTLREESAKGPDGAGSGEDPDASDSAVDPDGSGGPERP
jgi:hypothetical protein